MEWLREERSSTSSRTLCPMWTDSLYRTSYLMTGDASEAEDLVQEAFIRVARRWNRVRAMEYPLAYARRILVNLALDGAERRSRQRRNLIRPKCPRMINPTRNPTRWFGGSTIWRNSIGR